MYFQRIRFDISGILVGTANTNVLEHAIGEVSKKYSMDWQIYYDSKVPDGHTCRSVHHVM